MNLRASASNYPKRRKISTTFSMLLRRHHRPHLYASRQIDGPFPNNDDYGPASVSGAHHTCPTIAFTSSEKTAILLGRLPPTNCRTTKPSWRRQKSFWTGGPLRFGKVQELSTASIPRIEVTPPRCAVRPSLRVHKSAHVENSGYKDETPGYNCLILYEFSEF
jgi:hypothetical protein